MRTEDAWDRFIEHVAVARASPRFDADERDHKLEIAEGLRRILEMARDDGPWLSALHAMFTTPFGQPEQIPDGTVFSDHSYDLTVPHQNEWLTLWAAADGQLLRRALAQFLELDKDASERFARFANAAETSRAAGRIESDTRMVLAFGSLFNFVVAPTSLPMMRAGLFERLERILGYDPKSTASVTEQYENHLAFARQVHTRVQEHGIPVRDMLDVQSLIFSASRQKLVVVVANADQQSVASDGSGPVKGAGRHGRWSPLQDEFWTTVPPGNDATGRDSQRSGTRKRAQKAYLSVCAIYRDEAEYLQEWIEFHRLVGVERFFLYDNLSNDQHRKVLDPYLRNGTVVLKEWPLIPGQSFAYDDCLREHRDDSRWIAFIDLDEFLFSPTGQPVSELLFDYELWPGVGVNWAVFGTSGHRTRPSGLVIENYVLRRPTLAPRHRNIKSIVDPTRTIHSLSPHHFLYDQDGFAVDENQNPIDAEPLSQTKSVAFSRFRVNHYWTKSEREWREKLKTLEPWTGTPRQSYDGSARLEGATLEQAFNAERDEAIRIYLPALRQALASKPKVERTRAW